jgi:PEP-CTERM motif
MHKLLARLVQIAAALAIAGAAQAIPFTIAGGSGTPVGVAVGSTVTVVAASDLAGRTYDLSVGETSEKFDFLDVTLSGLGGAIGLIDANLDFLTPDVSAEGVLGGFGAVFGLISGGRLEVVDDGGPIALGDGNWFDVNFFGFDTYCFLCTSVTGTVQASITVLSAPPTSVPEPGTLSLLGAGLVAIGLMRRRKTKVQQAA